MMVKIDFEKEMHRFLLAHGWEQQSDNPFNPDAWFHPLFPFGEESAASCINTLYPDAWGAFEAARKLYHQFQQEQEKKE